jgi:hypothetical protein
MGRIPAVRGASPTPIERFAAPAASPFQNVLWLGVIPSISAVRWIVHPPAEAGEENEPPRREPARALR